MNVPLAQFPTPTTRTTSRSSLSSSGVHLLNTCHKKTNKGHAALAQHCWPTTPNIVGCYMLRRFAHPVFRRILQYFLPRKWKLPSVHERIINIRSDKGKPTVQQKGKKCHFGGFSFDMVCGTSKTFLIRANCAKIVLKINWPVKTPWHEHIKIVRSR